MSPADSQPASHPQASPPGSVGWMLLPREHGAWGMLLLPFVAGAVLGGRWDPPIFVSLLAVLLAFVVREPLTVLARQRWVWRLRKPESGTAIKALAWQAPVLLGCGLYLWMRLPRAPLLILGVGGALLTGTAVWMAVHNRSRSLALQLVSAFALASTALLAALSTTGGLPVWSWRLWGLMSAHSLIGVLTVHARLEHRLAPRTGRRSLTTRVAMLGVGLLTVVALGAWLFELPDYAPPLAFSALVAAAELVRLRSVGDEPFRRVGLRMLLLSLAHLAIVVGSLWRSASG